MCCVAHQHGLAVQAPAIQVQRRQRADRVAIKVAGEVRDQRQGIGEVAREQGDGILTIAHVGETGRLAFVGHEQGHGESTLVIGQCDAHVAAAWPDVQGIGLDLEAAIESRRDFQFLVAMAKPLGAFAERSDFLHFAAQGGAGAIATDQCIEGVAVIIAVHVVEDRDAGLEIHARKPLIEVQDRARGLGGIEQGDVEFTAADRPDHLGIIAAVALQLRLPAQRVHHAAAHHHRLSQHIGVCTGLAQCVQAAFGQCEVDRAATRVAVDAWIAAALEHLDLEAALRQQRRQQCAGEASTYQREVSISGHRSIPWPRGRSAARHQSCCRAVRAKCGSRRVRASHPARRAIAGGRTGCARHRAPP